MKLNRKWILVLALVMSLTLATTGTLAFLTDRDSDANVFTMGNVEIDLTEDFVDGSELIPGKVITKKPVITNTGKTEAWVWATVAIPSGLEAALNIEWATDANWSRHTFDTLVNPEDGLTYNVYTYLYNDSLVKDETTTPVISSVTLKNTVDINTDGQLYLVEKGVATKVEWNYKNDDEPVVYISAYAIQKEGFDTVTAGYDNYTAQWTTDAGVNNGIEWGEIPTIFSWEGVNYVTTGDTGAAKSTGGTILYRGIFSDGKSTVTSVNVGEGITRLNNRALAKAPTIASVSLPSTLTYIDESVFQQSGITEITVPENVTYIGKQAFGSCGSLEKIVINAKDVTIANYVARACANLKEVYINSDSVTFESGSMYFTNKENADASGITFYVKDQAMADTLYNAFSTSHSYGLLIKSLDGQSIFYNTLK